MRLKKKGKLQKERNKAQEAQVMQIIAHHQQTNALSSEFMANLSLVFTAEHNVVWYGICLWSAGVSCPSCVTSHLVVLSQPTPWWNGVRSRKGLHFM